MNSNQTELQLVLSMTSSRYGNCCCFLKEKANMAGANNSVALVSHFSCLHVGEWGGE